MTDASIAVYKYKIGDEVWVEDVLHGGWDTAKIVKLIQSVAGCYEVEFSTGMRRAIVNEYRIRRYVND